MYIFVNLSFDNDNYDARTYSKNSVTFDVKILNLLFYYATVWYKIQNCRPLSSVCKVK